MPCNNRKIGNLRPGGDNDMGNLDIDGTRLTGLMSRLGVSQAELAGACDVSYQSVWNWMSGKAIRPSNADSAAMFLRGRGANPAELQGIGFLGLPQPRAPLPALRSDSQSCVENLRLEDLPLESLVNNISQIEEQVAHQLVRTFSDLVQQHGAAVGGPSILHDGIEHSFQVSLTESTLRISVMPLFHLGESTRESTKSLPRSLGEIRSVVCIGPHWLDCYKIASRLGEAADLAYTKVAQAIKARLEAPTRAISEIRKLIHSTAEKLCIPAVAPAIRLIAFDRSAGMHLLDGASLDYALTTFKGAHSGHFSPLELLCGLLTESLPRHQSLSHESLAAERALTQPFQGAKFQADAKMHWIATRALLDHEEYGVYPLGQNLDQTLTASYPADEASAAVAVLDDAHAEIRGLFSHHMESFSSWVTLPKRALQSPPFCPGSVLA